MGRKKTVALLALVMLITSLGLAGCGGEEPPTEVNPYDAFTGAVDLEFAYKVALELAENPEYHDSPMGTRTSGSDAEHRAADYLAGVMEEIGLTDVEKVGVDVDKWQFNGASVTIEGEDQEIQLHSYATAATPAEGVTAELIYVGQGTMYDYEGIDAKGKIILCDVNQRDEWWVTYPMLEAQFQGAAGIIASSSVGFSEISDEAYNSNDICAPTGIPCTSITPKDAERLKARLEEGPLTATLKVDNIVEPGGTSYNIMGRIPGKSSEEMIIFGAHYDMYFTSFQDDSAAVGGALGIAKAMIDSGYVPERDIVFCIHGAEEWGASGTQFDWTTGAWRMINEAHPEWVGKALAFINFELPAYEFADYTMVYSAPEMYTMIDRFVNEEPSPKPVNCFSEGILTEGYQTYTYSDDFSYYVAGVPSTVNGFLLDKEMESVFPFYREIYHTNFDTKDTYNEDVFRFTVEFYGAFGIYIDLTPALQLDFSSQYDRLLAAIDEETAKANGIDYDAYVAAAEEYNEAAVAAFAAVDALNADYAGLVEGGASEEELADIWTAARAMNKMSLGVFKDTQDKILGLMYERPIVPHEAPQENIMLMNQCIAYLEEGNVQAAADEAAWQVNNVEQWYAMYFSPEVTKICDDMFYSPDNQDNLFWGTGKAFVPARVDDATRSLMARYEETGGDFTKEINIYKAAVEVQKTVYLDKVTKEIADVKALAESMKAITY
ncbi:hypothetical protein MASR2M70_13420 [Bacillota bacterium]